MSVDTPLLADHSSRNGSLSRPLVETLACAEAQVRARPQSPPARWLLFELLCVLGQWERALKQLQNWAALAKTFDSTALVLRGLIRAEVQREKVFAGRMAAASVSVCDTTASAWTAGLTRALALGAAGEAAQPDTDRARAAALAMAPDTPGSSPSRPDFAWITDSDTRLGPICEVVLAGAYRWLAFDDLRSITKGAPACLLDLVWSQVDLALRDGTPLKGYMPMRYPVQAGDRDAFLLARETAWRDVGLTGVHGEGQKVWATDIGDLPLLDLRSCDFGGNQASSESAANATR